MSEAADIRTRLARLVAAMLWDAQDYYQDIYERSILQEAGGRPDVDLVELTEDGRIEILADGKDFVLSIQATGADGTLDAASAYSDALSASTDRRATEAAFALEVQQAQKECGETTLEQLRCVAEILANSCFVRYWAAWYDGAAPGQALMALSAVEADGSPASLYERDMTERGFVKCTDPEGMQFWFIRRVDHAGKPYPGRQPC